MYTVNTEDNAESENVAEEQSGRRWIKCDTKEETEVNENIESVTIVLQWNQATNY